MNIAKRIHICIQWLLKTMAKKITIIPMSLSILSDFEEKCDKVSNDIGLKNFCIYEHKDSNDVNGKMVYGSSSCGGYFVSH